MESLQPRKVVTAVLAVTFMSATLTGCNADQVGAAAIIGGRPISVEELQAATQDYLELVPNAPQGEAQARILDSMIRSEVIAAAARAGGVSASAGEAAAVRDRAIAEFGSRTRLVRTLAQGENGQVIPPGHIDRLARDIVLQDKLLQKLARGRDANSPEVGDEARKAFAAAARSLDIEISPRYGTWNADQLALSAGIGGGLSKSVAERTRAAAGS
jgi:hypothetical protein